MTADADPITVPEPPFQYPNLLHGVGVLLGLVALWQGGVDNPDIGFPVAIAVLAGLGLRSSPGPAPPSMLRVIRGGVTKGGLRQGAFVKGMFGVALVYKGVFPVLHGSGSVDLPSLLLGWALLLTGLGSKLEARSIGRALAETDH